MREELAPLFEPFTNGSLTTANRFVMSPMTRNFSPDGVPSPEVADYYARRAHMGLVITEGVGPDHPSALGDGTTGGPALPLMYGEAALASWKSVVDKVHAAGGKIAPQLWHMGAIRLAGTGPHPEAPSISPSGIWGPFDKAMLPPEYLEAVKVPGKPASESDIADMIAGFARSAAYAHELGFDAIALHGGHGYMLDAFLWELTNQRSDQWGGDALKRTRFACEVVKAVRQVIPADKPIIYRFSQWKLQDYAAKLAQTPDELGVITGALADAGVDIFDVSTRHFDAPAFEGSNMGLSGWVRKVTGKPVMTVGGIGFDKDLQSSFMETTTPIDNLGEVVRRFEAGEFDLVAIGRACLMDADWIGKARRGEPFNPFDLSALGRLD
ncbi:MAG: 12-oxophytodienoate reductase [Hirschia sp.]|mgnify:CR=1 FL=1|nr:12-oxophytodienoate reductase [Hirschia sp.]